MPSRFEFERAIRRSGLPPLSRFLALTIATWADADTGLIARKNQPAQSVLLEATGMSKSSFLAHRKTLIDAGWVRCDSPDPIKAQKEHAQNVYFILIPAGKAGSGDDLAFSRKSDMPLKARSAGDRAKTGKSDKAGSGDDRAQAGEVGHAQEKLGRLPTTRVLPSTSTSLPTGEGRQAGSEERTPRAFDYCQPLINAMTEAGIVVSWTMNADDWQSVARVLDRAGVDAMVAFARGTKAREPIRFAKFFLKAGWAGLPPRSAKPRPAAQHLRSIPDWCGDPECDEKSRMRQSEDSNGLRSLRPCKQCHPKAKETAA